MTVSALRLPAQSEHAGAGVIFFHNVGYLGMCSHGTIGVVRSLVRPSLVAPGHHHVGIPAGPLGVDLRDDSRASIDNAVSCRDTAGLRIDVPGYGSGKGKYTQAAAGSSSPPTRPFHRKCSGNVNRPPTPTRSATHWKPPASASANRYASSTKHIARLAPTTALPSVSRNSARPPLIRTDCQTGSASAPASWCGSTPAEPSRVPTPTPRCYAFSHRRPAIRVNRSPGRPRH